MTLTSTPAVPRRVHVELTARCDLQCLPCAGAMPQRDKGDMDYAFFLRTAATLRRLGVEQLGLSYLGEPFLCRWLPEAVYHAKRSLGFPFVFLATHGRMATPERVRDCIEAGLDRLEFSTNYAGPDPFHYVTGAREQDFWKLGANLTAARLVRDEVQARTGHRCAIVASSIRFDAGQPRRMAGAAQRRACRALFEQAHVTYDGRVSACAFDHDRRFEMGELGRETFLEAWHGDRFERLRAAHLANDTRGTACEGCSGWQ